MNVVITLYKHNSLLMTNKKALLLTHIFFIFLLFSIRDIRLILLWQFLLVINNVFGIVCIFVSFLFFLSLTLFDMKLFLCPIHSHTSTASFFFVFEFWKENVFLSVCYANILYG